MTTRAPPEFDPTTFRLRSDDGTLAPPGHPYRTVNGIRMGFYVFVTNRRLFYVDTYMAKNDRIYYQTEKNVLYDQIT